MRKRIWKKALSNAVIVVAICMTLIGLSRFYLKSYAAAPNTATTTKTAATVPAAGTANWTTYMYGNDHTGVNPNETTISSTNASSLVVKWKFQAPTATSELVAEPIIENGILYEGSWDGYMYAMSATTGKAVWQTNLGTYRSKQCSARGGPSGSAAYDNGMIFVGSGPYMFALNATTGAIIWQQLIGTAGNFSDHIWGSSTVANGKVYVGIASLCDNPLTQGILYALDENTGQISAQADIVPNGDIGGGIWDAPTIDPATGTVIVTTGSIDKVNITPMEAAVVTLDWNTLAIKQFWQVPASERQYDADFGSSPTLFTASNGKTYFGCINKNTIYYIFDESNVTAGPVLERSLGPGGDKGGLQGSISSSAYLNGVLYITTSLATVMGVNYAGSIGAFTFDPTVPSLKTVWRSGTPGHFYTAPIIANGLVYDTQGNPGVTSGNVFEVRDINTGNVLYTKSFNSPIKASVTVLNGYVYIASFNRILYAMKPTVA